MSQNQHADVFAYLTSARYQGGQGRVSDLEHVVERARNAGVSHIISECEDLQDTLNILKLSRAIEHVHCIISLDPGVFRDTGMRAPYLREVRSLARRYRSVVVGVTLRGPCCECVAHLRRLRRALGVAVEQQLPVFFKWNKEIVKRLTTVKNLLCLLPAIIIHSFEGSEQEAQTLLNEGFFLGISCRSVMVPRTLEALVKLPLNKVLIHSGSPELGYLNDNPLAKTKFPVAPPTTWQAGVMLEGRGEPACVVQAVEVVAAIRGEDAAKVAAQIWKNVCEIFFPYEDFLTDVC